MLASLGARGRLPARFRGFRRAPKGGVQSASAGFRRSSGGIHSAGFDAGSPG
jgi:hypothetical protein